MTLFGLASLLKRVIVLRLILSRKRFCPYPFLPVKEIVMLLARPTKGLISIFSFFQSAATGVQLLVFVPLLLSRSFPPFFHAVTGKVFPQSVDICIISVSEKEVPVPHLTYARSKFTKIESTPVTS